MLTAWLPLFGIAYFWMGWTGKADRTFLAVGAAGKATFGVILLALWSNGELPMTAGLIGLPDLALAGVFAADEVRVLRAGRFIPLYYPRACNPHVIKRSCRRTPTLLA
jgi:hypothetical protein